MWTPRVTTTPRELEWQVPVLCQHISFAIEGHRNPEYDPLMYGDDRGCGYTELLIVDEADRLNTAGLEQLRDFFDRHHLGLSLIGMPGLEKRLARYPQLYSRIGFAHQYRPLSADELAFVLHHHWDSIGPAMSTDDFTDTEAIAAVARITGGNFRLIERLCGQIQRVLEINQLRTVTRKVVEAARDTLVIGTDPDVPISASKTCQLPLRVTVEQNPDLQVDELTAAGCWKVWTDHASGALDRRLQLDAVLEQLRLGDTLVVWRLDRLGRSLRHLIEVVTGLDERGVGFRSLRENIDTTTAGGRLVFHLFGALAQFEREIIRDRTVAGLTAARARGRVGGRPSKLTAEQVRQARRMYDARELTVEQIGDVLGVSRTSIYRALGKTTTPAPSATAAHAPVRPAEPVAATTEAEEDAPAELATRAPARVRGAPVRSRGRSRWFVVQADPADPEHGPVAVVSGHTSHKAATAALGRAGRRAASGVGEGALLQVRAADQISSRLVWDSQAGRGVVHPGPPP